MPSPKTFPQKFPSPARQSPHSLHPIDPHSPQDTSGPELRHDTRGGRPRRSTNDDNKRSRSNSTPPDNRVTRDQSLQRTGLLPVSAHGSRTWAQDLNRGWSTGNVEVNVQGQGMIQVGGPPVTQPAAKFNPRRRRSSISYPPTLTTGRTSTSSLVDSPVIPGVTTNVARPPSRLRKDSYQRPRILFYHKHEPHYGFTNFSSHPVLYGGKEYPTSEHLFQSFKVCRVRRRTFAVIV